MPVPCNLLVGETFCWVNGVRAIMQFRHVLWGNWGGLGGIKNLLKILSGRRMFYGVIAGGDLIHTGWVTLSHCRFYWVEDGAAVLGPVWTDSEWRGRGIACRALQTAINTLVHRGVTCFYIDTSGQNAAMQNVINKCGFGAPVGVFVKGPLPPEEKNTTC